MLHKMNHQRGIRVDAPGFKKKAARDGPQANTAAAVYDTKLNSKRGECHYENLQRDC